MRFRNQEKYFSSQGDLFELSGKQLEGTVVRIVECEGPIHSEEILQRIKSHTGISRMLGKIKQRIDDSIASAKVRENPGKRRILLFGLRTCIFLRRRDADAYAKIECICDEEIKEAVHFVLVTSTQPCFRQVNL